MASTEPPERPVPYDEPPFLGEPSAPAPGRPPTAARSDLVSTTFDSLRMGLLVLLVPVVLAALTLAYLGRGGTTSDDGESAVGDGTPSAVDGLVAGIGGGDAADLDAGGRTTGTAGRGAIGTGEPARGASATTTTTADPAVDDDLTLPSADAGPAGPATTQTPPPATEAPPSTAPAGPGPTVAPAETTTTAPVATTAGTPPVSEIPWGRCLITVRRRTTVREEPSADAGSVDRTSGLHLPTALSGAGGDRWFLIATWETSGWVPLDEVTAELGDCG